MTLPPDAGHRRLSSKTRVRLVVAAELQEGVSVDLTENQLHQLRVVQRMADGNQIALFNGRDGEWLAELQLAKKSGIAKLLHQTHPQADTSGPWLLFAPVKQGRIDFLVEKAAELGAERLTPVITRRTQAARIGLDRLQHAVREAAEQCERLSVTQVDDLIPLDQALKLLEGRLLYVCAEAGETVPLVEAFQTSGLREEGTPAFLTGPEGGFEPEELAALALHPNTTMVNLGPRILRAETAALAVLACWQAMAGDWSVTR